MANKQETQQTPEDSLLSLIELISDYLNSNEAFKKNSENTSTRIRDKTRSIIQLLTITLNKLSQNGHRLHSVEAELSPLISQCQSYVSLNFDEYQDFRLQGIYNEVRVILSTILPLLTRASLAQPQQENASQSLGFPAELMPIILNLLATSNGDELVQVLRASNETSAKHAAQVVELREEIYGLKRQTLRNESEAAREAATREAQKLTEQIYALQREKTDYKITLSIKLAAERRKARRELFEEMDITIVVNLLEKYDLFIANPESEDTDLILDTAFIQILAMRAFSLKTTLAGKLKDKIVNLVRDTTGVNSIHALFDQAEKWIEARSDQSDQ